MKIDDLPGLFGPGKTFSYKSVAPRATTAHRDFERMLKKLRDAEQMLAQVGIEIHLTMPDLPPDKPEKSGE